ncbi:MAG TPA: tail fiber domain-containing protein [Vicinamibacteria bacterium]|nr:tail fiber domain-containing protein [Vicinamibacteria bacterium]
MTTRAWLLAALGVLFAGGTAHAQGSAFTYQGRLASATVPADGSYDFEFRLFDSLSGGTQQGTTQTLPGVVVTEGLFTVGLNFGAAFDGAPRFLQISVRPAGGGAFTTIAPRQPITSAPYAVRAATAGNALQLGGVAASQYVVTTDPRLSDARDPLPGSASYVQNSTTPQAASFNITGGGIVGGTLSGGTVNAGNQYNLGGARMLSSPGTENLFVGAATGAALTSGTGNSFVGSGTGAATTGGAQNSFFGGRAGAQNTTGQQNVFVGFSAGETNTSGSGSTYVGWRSGQAAIAGGNTFVGSNAGMNTTTGGGNVFVGRSAGNGNTTGSENVFVGASTAQDSLSTATSNVLVGYRAGRTNRGSANTFLGAEAGPDNTTGQLNLFAGWFAGGVNTTGSSNVFLGYFAGDSNETGGANTLLGAQADVGAPDLSYATAIGAGSIAHASNTIVLGRDLGEDAVHIWGVLRVGLEGSGSLDVCRNGNTRLATCSSSLRYKSEVAPFGRGLDVVSRLRPIRFLWKDSGLADVGFAAEEVEAIEPLLATRGEDGRVEGVKYKQLTTVLVTSVQQLQRENEELRGEVARQRAETAALRVAVCRAGLLPEGCE